MNVVEALVVTLGLDASKFTAGQKEASASMRAVGEQSGQTAKELEARGTQGAEFFRKLRNEAVALFAVVTAGRGLKDLVRDITTSDAATGRLAHNLDMTTENLSAWEGAAQRAGGSASGLDGSMQGLTQQFQQFALTGQSAVLPYFRAIGVSVTDASGKIKPMGDLLLDLADKFQGMDPARASAIGAGLGLDQGTINLLEKGRGAVQGLLDEQRKLGLPNDADAGRAQALQKDLLDIQQSATSLARTLLNDLSPDIHAVLAEFDRWIQANREFIATDISGEIREFRDYLASVDWPAVGAGLKDFALGADHVAHELGGWKDISEVVFVLWAGAGVNNMLRAVGLLNTGLIGATGSGRGLLSVLGGIVGLSGTALAALGMTATLKGDTNPDATPDGFRKGWVPDNGPTPAPYTGPTETFGEMASRMWHGATSGIAGAASGAYKGLLDLIGKSEGTDKGRGYNETLGYGAYTGGDQNLTGMTLDQIDALQSRMLAHPDNKLHSSALGRYQITQTTLRDLRKQMGLDGQSVYDPALQDRLASKLIEQRADGSTPEQVQRGLSKIWASIPDPDTNRSAYGQGVGVTGGQVQAAIQGQQAGGGVMPAAYVPSAGARWGGGNTTHATSNDNSTAVNIQQITVNTKATDARGVAQGMRQAMQRYGFTAQANSGLS